jgi:hypothetical protein
MDLNNFVENTLGSWDVQELLCIKRVRLKFLVDSGKLKPMKVLKGETLFWKPDVMALRNELMKNVRSNLYKLEEKKHA